MKAKLIMMTMAASLVLAGCNGAPEEIPPVETPTLAERMQALDVAIREEVGIPRATSRDQCKLIAVGKRPCGGPQYYMAYSSATSDEQLLNTMVDEFNMLRLKQLQETNEMGICVVLEEPVVALSGGVCTLRLSSLY